MSRYQTPRAVAPRYAVTDKTSQVNALLNKAGAQLASLTKLSEQLLDHIEITKGKIHTAERKESLYKVASIAAKSGYISPVDVVDWVDSKMSETHPPEYYAQVFRAAGASRSAFNRS
jgi:hypothetical protein